MTNVRVTPTTEQEAVICHDGSAFVNACPGAGKTMVLTERARKLFRSMVPGRGVAFLSFTLIAISELETRLRRECLLPSPVFPNFIGTFDSFVWSFLIAPFGIKGSEECPRLIADIEELKVVPFDTAHPLPLSCFCPQTGEIDGDAAKLRGFDISQKPSGQLDAYKTAARRLRQTLRKKGRLGFDEARTEALERIRDTEFSSRIAAAISGRFQEVIVDEAQDCNPQDLDIVTWLREAADLPVKVVCDPHQSIFEFRGGVTHHLPSFADTFEQNQRFDLTGNFRSAPNICKCIVQFRPLEGRGQPDRSQGRHKDDPTPVYVLSYSGTVSASICQRFNAHLESAGIDVSLCPIVAATKASAAAAAGQSRPTNRNDRSVRLAEAVTSFHFAAGFNDVKEAIEGIHKILLEIEGKLNDNSYRKYLADNNIEPLSWRPYIMDILRELRFDRDRYNDAREWHTAAKELIESVVTLEGGQSIAQKLRWNAAIETVLKPAPQSSVFPRTIHSVKGAEFPAVCVITTTATLKRILDYLEAGEPSEMAEEARKLYVAASRAERLLAIAAPSSQADRLARHLREQGATVNVVEQ